MSARGYLATGASGFIAGIVLTGAAVNAAPKVEEPEVAAPAPEVHVVHDTKTVTKEIKVPVLSAECQSYIELTNATMDEIVRYEGGIAPQQQLLYDALGAIIDSDTDKINQSITDQNNVLSDTAGPLMAIMGNQRPLKEARAACLETLEGQ